MQSESPTIFEIKAKGCQAQGHLSGDGFLVLSGAVLRKEIVPSAPPNLIPQRQNLLSQGVLSEQALELHLMKDHLFDSPSGAAAMVMGRTANGWIEWKSPQGQTLEQLSRGANPLASPVDLEIRDHILKKHEQLLRMGSYSPRLNWSSIS